MEKPRVLFISQEITPYLPESEISKIGRNLPEGTQEHGKEIRAFMPRFGCINERRHQLHEVIRLSGMNLVVNDMDHPLIIKVASIQPIRMQVYFIDNEEYFKRKAVLTDGDGNAFEDNDERSIFFVKGVLETVKKLGWAPDIIHCHGWMTAVLPTYLKTVYKDDPLFSDSKVVYSAYNVGTHGKLSEEFQDKLKFDGISDEDSNPVEEPSFKNLHKLAIKDADAVILNEEVDKEVTAYAEELDRTFIIHNEENYIEEYNELYDKILDENSVLAQ